MLAVSSSTQTEIIGNVVGPDLMAEMVRTAAAAAVAPLQEQIREQANLQDQLWHRARILQAAHGIA